MDDDNASMATDLDRTNRRLIELEKANSRLRRAVEKAKAGCARAVAERDALRRSEERARSIVESADEYAIVTLDPAGRVTSWSEGARRILGYHRDEIVGADGRVLFTPEDRERGVPDREIRTALTQGAVADERWQVRKDGSRFWAVGVAQPLRGDDGGVLGLLKILRDRTEQRRSDQVLSFLAEAGELLSGSLDYDVTLRTIAGLAVEAVADFCFFDVITADNRVERAAWADNDPERRRRLDDAWRARSPRALDDPRFQGDPLFRTLRSGATTFVPRIDDGAVRRAAVDEEHLQFIRALGAGAAIIVPVAARGRVLGALSFCRSAHRTYTEADRRLAEELGRRAGIALDNARLHKALRDSEDRLRLAVETTGLGTWDYDPAAGALTWSDRCKALFGLPPEARVDYKTFLAGVHPDHREAAHRAMRRAFDPAGDGIYEDEFRTIGLADGVERWIIGKGRVLFEGGRAVRFIGTTIDITARKRAEEQLARQALESSLLHRATELVTETDSVEDALRGCVDLICDLIGWPIGQAFLPSADGGELVLVAARRGADGGIAAELRAATEAIRFAPGVGLPGRIWRSGEPAWIADVHRDPNIPRAAAFRTIGIRGAFGFPITVGNETAAVLEFFSEEAKAPDPNLLKVVGAAGQQVGRAIERRRAQELQALLLGELNHRVKNTLTLVQAIAGQTLRTAPSPEAFQASFAARLRALADAHDLLTRGNWQGADLREVLRAELAPHADDAARFSLDGAAVRLGPKAAVSLAMAFHELATNAAKHGALSVPTGRIAVSWATGAAGSGDVLRLVWAEAGGPPVAPPPRRGFGSRLIERALASELDGRASLAFEPDGLRCTMEFPLKTE